MSKYNVGDRVEFSVLGGPTRTGTIKEFSPKIYGCAYDYSIIRDIGENIKLPSYVYEREIIRKIEKEQTVKFEVGDIVSVQGVVTKLETSHFGLGQVVDIRINTGLNSISEIDAFVEAVTLVERPEKEIPAETIVEDSHGCRFILGSYYGIPNWIRISSPDGHGNDENRHSLTSFPGKALSKIARESM